MMKTLFVEKNILYSGEQLKPLNNYMEFGVLGTSIVSWVGACNVPFDHMIDGEDVRAQSQICGAQMVHFIIEAFDFPLKGAVVLQRLMAEMTIDILKGHSPRAQNLKRQGDDIYWENKKLNISIATLSPQSSLIHFAVNVSNEGTPVPTSALMDFSVEARTFAKELMERVAAEYGDIIEASQKVRTF